MQEIKLDLLATPEPVAEHSADWYNQRRQGIGGSDAAAVLGYSRWHSAYDVWRSKIDDADDSSDDAKRDNACMLRGRRREFEIIREYSDLTGKTVYKAPHLIHPEINYVCANLDGIIPGERVIEAKTSRRRDGWGEPGSEDIPIDYYLQTQHYMMIAVALDLIPASDPLCDIFVSIAGEAIQCYTIAGNKELWAAMLTKYADFWRHVTDLTPPDNLDMFEQVDLLPPSVNASKYADPFIVERVDDMRKMLQKLSDLEEIIKGRKAELTLYAGECDTVLNADGSTLYTCKTSKPRQTVDADLLRRKYPEIYSECLKQGKAARPLRLADNTDQ